MPRIELNDLLTNQVLTLDQELFLTWFYSQFDRLPAGGGNRHIVNVEPLYYQGATAGHECLTYAATKLYILLNGYFIRSDGYSSIASGHRVYFYNEADTAFLYLWNSMPDYNTATPAHNYLSLPATISNIYFSRFSLTDVTHMRIIGYRITLN